MAGNMIALSIYHDPTPTCKTLVGEITQVARLEFKTKVKSELVVRSVGSTKRCKMYIGIEAVTGANKT
jgi:hypothetical protein